MRITIYGPGAGFCLPARRERPGMARPKSALLAALCACSLALPGAALAAKSASPKAKPSRPARSAEAAPAGALDAPKVDSAKVHRLYMDGEFPAAIAILEDNLKETRQYAHGDSVFIFKHLGVMYAAQYDTREKGKYYMHRLLTVEPTAKIMDMYASDMIYMIFKNIQEEYEQTRTQLGSLRPERQPRETTAVTPPAGGAGQPPRRHKEEEAPASHNGKKWVWAGVAAATLAAGITAYVLLGEEEPQPSQVEKKF